MKLYITGGTCLSKKCPTDGAAYEIFEFADDAQEIVIPEGITHIAEYAFRRCRSLSSVIFPDSLTHIGDCAFEECISLSFTELPASLAYIGECAFAECNALIRVTLPASLTTLCDHAFFACRNLRSISIPASVTRIGKAVFFYCKSLHEVSLTPHHFHLLEGHTIFNLCTFIHCVAPIDEIPQHLRLDSCAGFARHEADYPPQLRAGYTDYLREVLAYLFDGGNEYFPSFINRAYLLETTFETPETVALLCREKLLSDAASKAFFLEAQKRQDLSLCALLLDYRCTLNKADEL